MDFILEHIDMIIVAIILIVGVAVFVHKFAILSKEERYEQIKAWLLQAVLLAEKEYGSGTGSLKLSKVYGQFCTTLPWLAKIISFEEFSQLVDKALAEAEELLQNNPAIASIVIEDNTDSVEETR